MRLAQARRPRERDGRHRLRLRAERVHAARAPGDPVGEARSARRGRADRERASCSAGAFRELRVWSCHVAPSARSRRHPVPPSRPDDAADRHPRWCRRGSGWTSGRSRRAPRTTPVQSEPRPGAVLGADVGIRARAAQRLPDLRGREHDDPHVQGDRQRDPECLHLEVVLRGQINAAQEGRTGIARSGRRDQLRDVASGGLPGRGARSSPWSCGCREACSARRRPRSRTSPPSRSPATTRSRGPRRPSSAGWRPPWRRGP